MRAIRDEVAKLRPNLSATAQIRTMKRQWVGKGLDELLARRKVEAWLAEQAA